MPYFRTKSFLKDVKVIGKQQIVKYHLNTYYSYKNCNLQGHLKLHSKLQTT